jgi:hypothetical protein
MPFRSDDTDELDGREWPEPDPHGEAENAVETVPCPFCEGYVYEDAEWCPHCRNYLFYDARHPGHKPLWLLGGVVVCMLVVLYWIVH